MIEGEKNIKDVNLLTEAQLRIAELEQKLTECQISLACARAGIVDLKELLNKREHDLVLCIDNAEKAYSEIVEKAEVKGRTDAMEWCQKLVNRWRMQHDDFELWRMKQTNPAAHVDTYEDFADELEEHISAFANV